MLAPFTLIPTANKDDTPLVAKGAAVDMQWVRWNMNLAEFISGYQSASLANLVADSAPYTVATGGKIPGLCRSLFSWADNSGVPRLGVGTHKKLAILYGGGLYDITPIRTSGTLSADPFATTSGSTTVVVTHTSHGAGDGDTVILSGASAVGGVTPLGPYVITYINANSYSITVSSAAGSTTTGGGASVAYRYEISIGNPTGLGGLGYGTGGYGSGTFGSASTGAFYPRTWSQSQFGEYLVANPRGGTIYQWQLSTTTRAAAVSGAPSQVTSILVTPERFPMAFGAHDGSAFDPLLIRWPDQETLTDWTPAVTNAAGDIRLSEGSRIVCPLQGRGETLALTDKALYAIRYLGDPNLVYGQVLLGTNCGAAGAGAACSFNGKAYWYSKNRRFYVYDGAAPRELQCPLKDFIANQLAEVQDDKIACGPNGLFGEVWWWFPIASTNECGLYVGTDGEGSWFFGLMARTAWIDAGIDSYPVAAGIDATDTTATRLYIHEIGDSADGAALPAYLQTGWFSVDGGESWCDFFGLIADFHNMTSTVNVYGYAREYPQSTDSVFGPWMVGSATGRVDARMSGRFFALRFERPGTGTGRFGINLIDTKAAGRRP